MARSENIVFFGTPPFAAASLASILKSGHKVSLVVTQPDRPAGRGQKIKTLAVKELAQSRHLPLLQPAKMKDPGFHQALRDAEASWYVVAAYGRLLPRAVLDLPKLILNVHASLLPKWRGAAPIERAILSGETVTGISIMKLVEKLDAGDVLLQRSLPIGPDETGGELEERLAKLGSDMLIESLELLSQGKGEFIKQDEGQVTLAPPIKKEEGKIRWEDSAASIHNRVRAFNPWPGAYTSIGKGMLKIHRTALPNFGEALLPPGRILISQPQKLFVACGDRWLEILELQREGKNRQAAGQFLTGYRPERAEQWK